MSKSSTFWIVRIIQFCSNFTSMWSKCLSNNVWRDFRLPMSAIATAVGKSFNGKFTSKIDFFDRVFYVTIAKVSPMLVPLASEIWTKLYGPNYTKFWAFWPKKNGVFKTIFEEELMPLWKTFLWLKQLFNAKPLISRLPSFCVPKTMVVRHL